METEDEDSRTGTGLLDGLVETVSRGEGTGMGAGSVRSSILLKGVA